MLNNSDKDTIEIRIKKLAECLSQRKTKFHTPINQNKQLKFSIDSSFSPKAQKVLIG